MNNYDIILLSVLFILCFILISSNFELFNQYPIANESDFRKIKNNMSRNDFIILNNFLKNVKNKLNKSTTFKLDDNKMHYAKKKIIQKLPESDKIAKKVVQIFNQLNQYNKIKLLKTTTSFISIFDGHANINFNMLVNYKIQQNESLVRHKVIKGKQNNLIFINIDCYVKLNPKPNYKNIYYNNISLTYYKKLWYLSGNDKTKSFSASSSYSQSIVKSDSYNESILKNKKITELKARLEALIKKKKKKEKFSSISETVANPKTDELNEYFSHMN